MYVPDTKIRIEQEIIDQNKDVTQHRCEICDQWAVYVIPIYNPTDEIDGLVDDNGKIGAAYLNKYCQKHYDEYLETRYENEFDCTNCQRTFMINHSWDNLVVIKDGEEFCHTCAAKLVNPCSLNDLKIQLEASNIESWTRLNTLPGKTELWSGEYSDYSDFSGYTNLAKIYEDIQLAHINANLDPTQNELYLLITQTFQFSVVLGVYIDKGESK